MDYPKYPHIENLSRYDEVRFPLGENVEIKEKVDGTNIRFHFAEEGLVVGSRKHMPVMESQKKDYKKYKDFIIERFIESGSDFFDGISHLIFYAEGRQKVHINYDTPYKHTVVGFDVFDTRTGKFRKDWKELFEKIGIIPVRVFEITIGYSKDIVGYRNICTRLDGLDQSDGLVSFIDDKSPIEGVMFADYENQTFYKYKLLSYTKKVGTRNKRDKTIKKKNHLVKYLTYERVKKVAVAMQNGDLDVKEKNPLSSLFINVMLDILDEVSSDEILKALGKDFASSIIQLIMSDVGLENIRGDVINLRKRDE